MKTLLLGTFLVVSLACTRDLEIATESPANPSATEQPVATGVGALRDGFDPDTVAPKTTAAASGHDHHDHSAHGASGSATPAATTYTCPHHPEVVSDKPGKCPKCNMDLEPKKDAKPTDPKGGHDHGAHP